MRNHDITKSAAVYIEADNLVGHLGNELCSMHIRASAPRTKKVLCEVIDKGVMVSLSFDVRDSAERNRAFAVKPSDLTIALRVERLTALVLQAFRGEAPFY
ncbi:hypothetical protein SVAN01_10527 [Stagonosporopsis vannaccii]|nr:hypothetical protein SVAN01_10527 [Stagonosporopsis vannaccii]